MGLFKVSLSSPGPVYTQKLRAAIRCSMLIKHSVIILKCHYNFSQMDRKYIMPSFILTTQPITWISQVKRSYISSTRVKISGAPLLGHGLSLFVMDESNQKINYLARSSQTLPHQTENSRDIHIIEWSEQEGTSGSLVQPPSCCKVRSSPQAKSGCSGS